MTVSPDRLIEIERLHAREPAPPWAGELLEEVRRLHGRADTAEPTVCPGCHREIAPVGKESPDDALTRHQQQHNRGGDTVSETMDTYPPAWKYAEIDPDQAYADGYRRGYDVATARAESRRRDGLPIEPEG